jgi:hypothetical protein
MISVQHLANNRQLLKRNPISDIYNHHVGSKNIFGQMLLLSLLLKADY